MLDVRFETQNGIATARKGAEAQSFKRRYLSVFVPLRDFYFGRCLRPELYAYTAQALATVPVSAAIPNAGLWKVITSAIFALQMFQNETRYKRFILKQKLSINEYFGKRPKQNLRYAKSG